MQDLIDQTVKRRPVDYTALMRYLATRSAVPAMTENRNLPIGLEGSFNRGVEYGPTGRIELAGTSPAYVGTLLHELTHAAQMQMGSQTQEKGATPQFVDAFKKLAVSGGKGQGPAAMLATKPQPNTWAPDYATYRTNDLEAPAFAVGNQSSGIDPAQRAAGHIDPTLATEFMILLDLATRDMTSRAAGGKKP